MSQSEALAMKHVRRVTLKGVSVRASIGSVDSLPTAFESSQTRVQPSPTVPETSPIAPQGSPTAQQPQLMRPEASPTVTEAPATAQQKAA